MCVLHTALKYLLLPWLMPCTLRLTPSKSNELLDNWAVLRLCDLDSTRHFCLLEHLDEDILKLSSGCQKGVQEPWAQGLVFADAWCLRGLQS